MLSPIFLLLQKIGQVLEVLRCWTHSIVFEAPTNQGESYINIYVRIFTGTCMKIFIYLLYLIVNDIQERTSTTMLAP